jgi:hypothetical protein
MRGNNLHIASPTEAPSRCDALLRLCQLRLGLLDTGVREKPPPLRTEIFPYRTEIFALIYGNGRHTRQARKYTANPAPTAG